MWRHREDITKPVLTGEKQVQSAHGRTENFQLPETAVLLYMSGLDYIREQYKIELITKRFPRFLNACPVWRIQGEKDICFWNYMSHPSLWYLTGILSVKLTKPGSGG